MNTDWQERTRLLLGEKDFNKLSDSHVLIAGLGGVGGYVAEQLARAGIGELTIIDGDTISPSNMNRQLIALHSTQGQSKAEVMAARIRDINPSIRLHVKNEFLRDQAIIDLMSQPFDYVVDAIDTLSPKVFLLYYAVQNHQHIVSCMGAAGKFHPERIEICDIAQSHHCRLAFHIRKKLHKLGITTGITTVFSAEPVSKSAVIEEESQNKASNVGSISFMPAAFGCFCASAVINGLLGKTE